MIKFGEGVKEEEARNLKGAGELLKQTLIRVPRFYRYFSRDEIGYIVMEYIDGRFIEPCEYRALAERVSLALTFLHHINGCRPGPIFGGISRGILWDSDRPHFKTVQAMEDWFNARLIGEQSRVALGYCKLVLCHLDVAPRNILLLHDGSICLLDWASAGFYSVFRIRIVANNGRAIWRF